MHKVSTEIKVLTSIFYCNKVKLVYCGYFNVAKLSTRPIFTQFLPPLYYVCITLGFVIADRLWMIHKYSSKSISRYVHTTYWKQSTQSSIIMLCALFDRTAVEIWASHEQTFAFFPTWALEKIIIWWCIFIYISNNNDIKDEIIIKI